MAYALSFSDEFFIRDGPDQIAPSPRPTSVYQAIHSLREDAWRAIAHDVFGAPADRLTPHAVLAKIIETDTCTYLDEPVEVWIDAEGCHTLDVYAPRPTQHNL